MAQFVRPVADVDDGSWASTPFFSKIDEDIGGGGDDSTIASDAVSNNVNTSDLDLEGTNSGITDPAISTGHILRVLWSSSATDDMTGHFELWQGVPDVGSLLAEATVELVDTTEVETTHTLTAGEADSITDYNDLHFALWGRGTGGGPARSLVVDAAELELPDATGDQTVTGSLLARSTTFLTGIVTPGNVTTVGTLLTRSPSFPTGAVNATNTITGSLLARSPTFPTGTVTPGNVTVTGVLLTRSPTFPTGAVTLAALPVVLVEVHETGSDPRPDRVLPTRFILPPVGTTPQTITGVLLARSPTFPTGSVTLADGGMLALFATMI